MSGRLCEENMNLELKRRKMERASIGYFNKKKIKHQWKEQDIRNKNKTKTPPLQLLLPQTSNNNNNAKQKRGSPRLSILRPLFCSNNGERFNF